MGFLIKIMESELVIQGVDFPPLSARGCFQKLWTIGENNYRRTIDGSLVFVGTKFKKYKTRIEGEDKTVLTTDSLFAPGSKVIVDCIQRLWQVVDIGVTKVTLNRLFVPNSIILQGGFETKDQEVFFEKANLKRFLSYRPRLSMMVLRYEMSIHEWDFKSKWMLELEED